MVRCRSRQWAMVWLVSTLSLWICLAGFCDAVPIDWASIAPLPLPRHSGATAVVDGVIYAIGGIEYGNSMTVYGQRYEVTTGAVVDAYDPATNTWIGKEPLPYPIDLMTRKAEGRQWLAAAAYNGKIYTFGGANIYGEVHDTIDVYGVSTDTWTAGIARLPESVVGMSAAAFGDKIYLFGGSLSTDPFGPQDYIATCYVFDPATHEIDEIAPMPIPRFKTTAVAYMDGLLVLGGISGRASVSAQRYDPVTDTWTSLEPVFWQRRLWGGAVIGEEMFLIAGRDEHALSSCVVSVYWSEEGVWTSGTPLSVAREDAFVVAVDGALYVIGGLNHEGIPLADAERGVPDLTAAVYEPPVPEPVEIAITWTEGAPMPTPRYYGATAVVDNTIYTIGGLEGQDATGRVVEAYDPVADAWTAVAPLPEGRFNVAAATFEEKIYVFGGADVDGNVVDTVDRYDPATDIWEARIATLPAPAAGIALTVFEDHIYLFGGSRSSQMFVPAENYTNAAYAFDPETLTFEPLPPMPIARNMAFAGTIDDEIFVIGGMKSPGATANQCYQPRRRSWEIRAEMPHPRGGHTGVVIRPYVPSVQAPARWTTALFILGGANTIDVYGYDENDNRWRRATSITAPRNMTFTAVAVSQEWTATGTPSTPFTGEPSKGRRCRRLIISPAGTPPIVALRSRMQTG